MTPADALDEETCGMLLAFAQLEAPDAAWLFLDDARRGRGGGPWRDLAELDETTRARTLSAWQVRAREAPVAVWSRLHPSWIAEALVDERAEVAAVVRAGCAAAAPEDAQGLARLALGHLLPLCEAQAGPLAERLCSLTSDELLDELAHAGARLVGQSLAGASPALRARAMAAAGEPWAQDIAAASLAEAAPAEREVARRAANIAGVASTAGVRERLAGVGLSSVKEALAREHPASLARVAGRLPAVLGRPLVGW